MNVSVRAESETGAEGRYRNLEKAGNTVERASAHGTARTERDPPAFGPPLHSAAIGLIRGMELPAAGEHVFAVEGIEKKRIRKVAAVVAGGGWGKGGGGA